MATPEDRYPRVAQGKRARTTWRQSFQFPQPEALYGAGEAPLARRPEQRGATSQPGEEQELQGVYIISVAARLLQMHPQTLRKYERMGLVAPSRTVGMLRLYSREDIAKLRVIKHLVEDLGLNLAGVDMVLSMMGQLLSMRRRLSHEAEESLRDTLRQGIERLLELLEPPFS